MSTSCNREWLAPTQERIKYTTLLLRDEWNTQHVYRTGREYVPRVIENELLLLTDESNTQHVPRTGRDLVPRVIENDLPLLRN